MIKVLVLGSNGQIGQELMVLAPANSNFDILFLDRQTVGIEDSEKLNSILLEQRPDFIVNCAAYTKVDDAEKEIAEAMKTNGYAVGHLSRACHSLGIKLIHISSDYTYDNGSALPLKETDPTLPKSIYAKSKLAGDLLAMEFNPQTIILRTSWVYSVFGHNFVKTILKLSTQKSSITIVDDQYGCPTSARDIAHTIYNIIQHIHSNPKFNNYGVYNYANEGVINWKEFAKEIFLITNKEVELFGQSTANYNAPAPRPLWSFMNLGKIKSTFPIQVHHWRNSLREMLQRLETSNN